MLAATPTCVPLTRRCCPISTRREYRDRAADRAGLPSRRWAGLRLNSKVPVHPRTRRPKDARARVLQLTKLEAVNARQP